LLSQRNRLGWLQGLFSTYFSTLAHLSVDYRVFHISAAILLLLL